MKSIRKQQRGFTIIEVMIVLMIAGMIMLIVFLAVPALRRNARNTERNAQVSNYIAAVNEFITTNKTKLPASNDDMLKVNALSADGPYTEPTQVQTGARDSAIGVDAMELVTGAKCDPNNQGNTIAASTRAFAIRFAVENSSGGAVPQCQES